MKTLNLLALFTLTLFFTAAAQPTIDLNDIKYTVGQTLTYNRTYYEAPGDSGANQTWDLSNMITGQVSVLSTVAPSSTPLGSSFPNANIAVGTAAGYSYYNQTAGALQFYGINANTLPIAYSNPEDFLRFPATYNDVYTDTWASTFVSGGTTFYRTGVTDVKVDGYGTLLLPNNVTHNNVIRVRFYQVYQDSSVVQGLVTIIKYISETYMWYVSGVPSQVASVNQFETINGPSQSSGTYVAGVTSGIEDAPQALSLNVYPNPVTGDFVNVSFDGNAAGETIVKWMGVDGRLLSTDTYLTTNTGNQIKIALPELSNGLYQMLLFVDGKPLAVKRVVVNR